MRLDLLIYNKDYRLWRDGIYLGIATWTQDENIGDNFLRATIDESGRIIHEVYVADKWELIINKNDIK